MSKYPTYPILIVDDEEKFLLSASLHLRSVQLNNIVKCADSRQVMPLLEEQEFSMILLDMMMPHVSGRELVEKISNEYPTTPLIIITAVNDVDTAVACMKAGAYDYIVKPMDKSRLVSAVKRVLELREMRYENRRLKKYLLSGKLENPDVFEEIITQNMAMRSIFQYLEAVSRTFLPVLITGETGTGKEMISKSIHTLSGRSGKFVAVNVAGLDDNLFSDALFGHKKGAYTGATTDRKGLVEQAADGTLFLDEIGDLNMESQIKLLRLLQAGRYYPLGSDLPKVTNARVVVATNLNLEQMQENGTFRKDLYYRLISHHVHIPSLRERQDDIPLLVDHFLEKAAHELNKKKPTVPKELYDLLQTYHFPGNIRELEGMIFDAVSTHKSGVLSIKAIKNRVIPDNSARRPMMQDGAELTLKDTQKLIFQEQLPTLKEAEELIIEEALKRSGDNQTIAAQLLGMSRKALNNRLIRSRK